MKIIIDFDALAAELKKSDEEARAGLLLNYFREVYRGKSFPWAERVKETKACPKNYTPEFEAFWKKYPRKTGKRAAFKSWWKCADGDQDVLLRLCNETLDWQIVQDQWTKDDGQFIPHASTWLNQERFLDEKPEHTGTGAEYLAADGTWQRR